MLLDNFSPMIGSVPSNWFGGVYGGKGQHGRAAGGGVGLTERYRSAKRAEKGRILDALCATVGWHRKDAAGALGRRAKVKPGKVEAPGERKRRHGATIKDPKTALWEASDRVCGKRLKLMIPTLLTALEPHGRLQLGQVDRDFALAISAASSDRLLVDVKLAASGGRRAPRRSHFGNPARSRVRTFMIGRARRPPSVRSTWSPMAARRWLARSSRP